MRNDKFHIEYNNRTSYLDDQIKLVLVMLLKFWELIGINNKNLPVLI
jgi:hypothetical protein